MGCGVSGQAVARAKTRLAGDGDDRARLVLAMLSDALVAVVGAGFTPMS